MDEIYRLKNLNMPTDFLTVLFKYSGIAQDDMFRHLLENPILELVGGIKGFFNKSLTRYSVKMARG